MSRKIVVGDKVYVKYPYLEYEARVSSLVPVTWLLVTKVVREIINEEMGHVPLLEGTVVYCASCIDYDLHIVLIDDEEEII